MTASRSRIMVVEDDLELNEALSSLLRKHDYEVVSLTNGAEALAQLRKQPDVCAIVLDVNMPVMNGASFRGEQLRDPVLAAIPTVLVTARADAAPLATMLQPAALLQKPVLPEVLLAVLEKFR